MAGRQQWLVEQQLADADGDRVRLRANAIMVLQRRELLRTGDELAGELGKPFVERSEEHTSELQSLMRISYAVFCLKKKKDRTHIIQQHAVTIVTITYVEIIIV